MLDFLFRKKNHITTRCIILYAFEYNRASTKELFEFLINYFKEIHHVEFKYGGFYDERYKDDYGIFNSIYPKFSQRKSDKIVNFSLDVDNLREKKRTIGVEFNISRPTHIVFFFPDRIEFNTADFLNKVFYLFKPIYGFSYLTSESYWATAYAIADWQHSKAVLGIDRLSRKYIEHWQVNCEKTQSGYMRDVYNENILNQKHLMRLVKGRSLEQYIVENNIGNLQAINQELSIWKLDDRQLQITRKYLRETEIVV